MQAFLDALGYLPFNVVGFSVWATSCQLDLAPPSGCVCVCVGGGGGRGEVSLFSVFALLDIFVNLAIEPAHSDHPTMPLPANASVREHLMLAMH